jgi:MFS family permease
VFYGWWIVGSVFVVQLFMVGFYSYGYPLIIVPVKEEFGASDKQIGLVMSLGTIVGLVAPPLVGPLVDRWSARGLMLIGASFLVIGLGTLSLTRDILQFVVAFALLMGTANVLLGPMTGSTLVSRWFTTSRGRALGIAATGTSIGGMLLPRLIDFALTSWGWRSTLQGLAVAIAVVVVPLLLFVLRDRPSQMGLEPEGAAPPSASEIEAGLGLAEEVWSTGQILRSRSFWLIGGCLGLLFMSYMTVLSILGLYVRGLGLDVSLVTTLVTWIALFGFLGKIVFGYAADRIGLRPGLWMALGLAGSGIALLSLEPGPLWIQVAAVLMGFAAGGMLPVWGAMVAAAFGMKSYGRVMGLMTSLIGGLMMPGFVIAGAISDATGGFVLALWLFTALIVLSALMLLGLRLPVGEGAPGTAAGSGEGGSGDGERLRPTA